MRMPSGRQTPEPATRGAACPVGAGAGRRPEALILLSLAILCAVLRMARLDAWPMFIDEGLYARPAQLIAAHPGAATLFIAFDQNYGSDMPLFTWLAAPFARLLADPLFATRLASATVGTFGLLAVWATARTLWGWPVAAIAGALYALCPFLVFYGRLALVDATLAACSAGALLFAVLLARDGRGRDALALAACIVAGLLTKPTALSFLALPPLAVLAARPRGRRVFAYAAGSAALSLALWGAMLLLLRHAYPSSSVLHGHLRLSSVADGLGIVAGQAGTWVSSLWLYVTPTVLVLAVLGLGAARRERLAWLVGLWALVSCLLIVSVPNQFFVPRYVVDDAVPIVVLGARGIAALADLARARLPSSAPAWLSIATLTVVAAGPGLTTDVTMAAAPADTPLVAIDRHQYVTGWPSGYTLGPVVGYLRRQEARHPITVVSDDVPMLMLRVLLYRDGGITYTMARLTGPRAIADAVAGVLHDVPGRFVYIVSHHADGAAGHGIDARFAPGGHPLRVDRHHLRLAAQSLGPRRGGVYDVYAVIADAANPPSGRADGLSGKASTRR